MPELDWISIAGFKSIASIDALKLNPINLLIGSNGSGKSNFIGTFSFLHAIREGRLQDYVIKAGGADRLLHFGTKTTQTVSIHISFQGGINQYRIVLTPSETDELLPAEETVYFWDKKKYPTPYDRSLSRIGKEAGISSNIYSGIAGYVRRHLDRWRLYHVHDTSPSSPLKRTASLNDNRFLRSDGSNLASFLYLLKNNHEESYSLIKHALTRVAPFFYDFVLEPQLLNPDQIRLEWTHKNFDKYFDVSALSDGTLRFLTLATLLLQPPEYRPSVILVDEPELGLHPYAITMLASMIKSVASSKEGTQIILSTQSSLLLDHFEPEDVLVSERVQGGTQLRRLASTDLKEWLQEYSLGQLWEKNEFGGRPVDN